MAKRRNQINRQLKRETRERKAQSRFIESPTPKKARHIAGAEARKEYSPVLRGLRSEVAGSKKREGELGSWYGGLTSQIGQAQQNAAASSQAAESALTQRLANASASDQSALKEQASKNEALGKLLGTNQVGVSNAPSASAGATAIAQQRVALTSPLTAERANYQNYLGQRGVSATERGIEARKAETSRRRKIKEDLRAGKKERGQAVVSNLEKLREGARDYAIQKQAFGQKTKEFGAERQENAIERAQKARENAASRAISAESAGSTRISAEASARNAATTAKKLRREGKSGGLTATQRRNQKESHQDAMAAVQRTIKANGVPKSPQEWAGLEAIVAKESGVGSKRASEAVKRFKERTRPKREKEAAVKAVPSGF
jgi:hypothetical protein